MEAVSLEVHNPADGMQATMLTGGQEGSETGAAFSQDQAWQRSGADLQVACPQVGLLHCGLPHECQAHAAKLPQSPYKIHAEAQLMVSKMLDVVTHVLSR